MDTQAVFKVALLHILFASEFVNWTHGHAAQDSALYRLYRYLTTDYLPVHPRINTSESVDVLTAFYLEKIVDVDTQNGVLVLHGAFHLKWKDDFLVWNTSSFDEEDEITLSTENVWHPAVGIYNSVSRFQDDLPGIRPDSPALVRSDGTVEWRYTTLMEVSCQMYFRFFPYDEQTCRVYFGSPGHLGNDVQFYVANTSIEHNINAETGLFKLISSAIYQHDYSFGATKIGVVALEFSFNRLPEFYVITLICPCLVLSVLGLLAFCLPVDSGERISLQVTTMLSFTVFQTMTANFIPPSEPMPLMNVHFFFMLVMSCVSLVTNVIVLRIANENPSWRLPAGVLASFFKCLGKLVCYYKYPENDSPPNDSVKTDNTAQQGCYPGTLPSDKQPSKQLSKDDVANILDRVLFAMFSTTYLIIGLYSLIP